MLACRRNFFPRSWRCWRLFQSTASAGVNDLRSFRRRGCFDCVLKIPLRGGLIGERLVHDGRQNDHSVCSASERDHFVEVAATPPLEEGSSLTTTLPLTSPAAYKRSASRNHHAATAGT